MESLQRTLRRTSKQKQSAKETKKPSQRKSSLRDPKKKTTLLRKKTLDAFKFGLGIARNRVTRSSATPEMLRLAEVALPPTAPAPIKDGKSDASVFFSTYNLRNAKEPLNATNVAFWLPLGFDVYVLSLQSAEQMTQTGHNILTFLQSQGEIYQKYTHFATLEDALNHRKSSLITYLFVHSTLVDEGVFKRKTLFKVLFPPRIATVKAPCAGAFVVNFSLFDTDVQIVNCQLTPGKENKQARIDDLRLLMNRLKEDEADVLPDHVFLMGDFSTSLEKEMEDLKLKSFITSKSEMAGWDQERFRFLIEQHDELSSNMKKLVPELTSFQEQPIQFPPTNQRFANPLMAMTRETVAELFNPSYDLEDLYEYKDDLPCYPDRIFFSTREECYKNCLKPGTTGSCEGVTVNERVPVFSTFRIGARSLGEGVKLKSKEELARLRRSYRADVDGLDVMKHTENEESEEIITLKNMPPPPPPEEDLEDEQSILRRVSVSTGSEQKLILERSDARMGAFTGFSMSSIPSPPPRKDTGGNLPMDPKEFEDILEDSDQTVEHIDVEEFAKLKKQPPPESMTSIGTNVSNTVLFGEQLKTLLNTLHEAQPSDNLDPPPPPPVMMTTDKNKSKLKKKNTLPPPPPSGMHGKLNDSNGTLTSWVDKTVV